MQESGSVCRHQALEAIFKWLCFGLSAASEFGGLLPRNQSSIRIVLIPFSFRRSVSCALRASMVSLRPEVQAGAFREQDLERTSSPRARRDPPSAPKVLEEPVDRECGSGFRI